MRLPLFHVFLAGIGALPLAGCLTSGTNMHGNFDCRAPGGTCAPMTRIDAAAVAGLGATSQPLGATGTIDVIPRNGRMVTASADGLPPGRTSDRVLKIVFPAHIDASGVYHDEAAAHAVVEHGVWTDGLTGGQRNALPVTGRSEPGQKAAATGSPAPITQLATLEEVIALQAARRRETAPATTEAPLGTRRATPASAGGIPAPSLNRSAAQFEPLSYPSSATLEPRPMALREAAAAAIAPPIAKLDANYDTPDVMAVIVGERPSAVATPCVGYRIVRWHGHDYRRPYQRSCGASAVPDDRPQSSPPRIADAASALPSVATAETPVLQNGNPATAALNRAQLQRLTAAPAVQAIASTSGSSVDATRTVASAALPATNDPEVAKARVDAMASPVLGAVVLQGRAATAGDGAALKSGLDRLTNSLAAFSTASAPAQAGPAAGIASVSEPRP